MPDADAQAGFEPEANLPSPTHGRPSSGGKRVSMSPGDAKPPRASSYASNSSDYREERGSFGYSNVYEPTDETAKTLAKRRSSKVCVCENVCVGVCVYVCVCMCV
jgi:hypothetical protein